MRGHKGVLGVVSLGPGMAEGAQCLWKPTELHACGLHSTLSFRTVFSVHTLEEIWASLLPAHKHFAAN